MLPPPSVIRQNLPKLSKNLKCPPPPRPKAELREAKGLPKPPRARGRGALGGLGRALPSLSSAFGRGGGGHFRFFESFGKFCLMTERGATFKYESS